MTAASYPVSAPADGSAPRIVYLVQRSQYQVPMGHWVQKFEVSGLLAWFQAFWDEVELLPAGVDGAIEEWERDVPSTWEELREFAAGIQCEGSVYFDEHAIQCLTDDDEIETPWYLFDDVFAAAYPERVAYLLREDWRLPEGFAETGLKLDADVKHVTKGTGEGCVYSVFLTGYDSLNISDITGNFRFDGVRLPNFGQYLAQKKSPLRKAYGGRTSAWPEDLLLLRTLILKSNYDVFDEILAALTPRELNGRCTKSGTLMNFRFGLRTEALEIDPAIIKDPQRFLEGDSESCEREWEVFAQYMRDGGEYQSAWKKTLRPPLVQTSRHMCQIRFLEDARSGRQHHTWTWAFLFFDDLWLAANHVLGESILRYGAGAEVLNSGEELGHA